MAPQNAAEAGKTLGGLVKSIVGVTVRVQVTEPETVARSNGKMVRVLDERPRR